ncbi:poly-beta-1,6 N-acetyl-D-glucosamine synthase [Noviherbaspirillum cavernae]|uniref:Poly-beta-1,6-N-acetyl-D-glucosamine synthase n=1 Tax=Noviherbaspirillum cavernae TaxID=2320862 RepID=A0A418X0J9_9BURK|nr:poly-beta-1,6-N-acetyl-D-glucosamine synthase [Noviherbaspirillum cavernae]RJG06024.1 poly-beta-1,6 N-acetyl-D-glucosamine synthase [Noviherbaspirillum cavernae]
MALDILLFDFTFYYPLFMSYLWMTGAIAYYFHYERDSLKCKDPLSLLRDKPLVSIIVPCYNEEDNVREVVDALSRMNYPDYEIICVNDGSKDNTGAILNELLDQYPRLRVIHQEKNQGKAVGLNTAALLAKGEYLLCIDGDSILDPDAIPWMLRHFESGPRVGAVTGNPRIRTRSTLLGRLQVGEFSSIVGIIKRAQRTYGRLFTVSGVVTMFRRRAVLQAGFWSPDMLTEDIDISWKLQVNHWDARFEPHALCWILMPETLAGLWKQRLRWAMGGSQAIRKYAFIFTKWRFRRMWPIYLEYVGSVFWAYAMGLVVALWLLGLVINMPLRWQITIVPGWHGALIGTTCLFQVMLAMWLDRRYDQRVFRHFFWMIWYPLAYWMLNMCVTIWSVPKVFARRKGRRAVWISPDRGVRMPVPETQAAPASATGLVRTQSGTHPPAAAPATVREAVLDE